MMTLVLIVSVLILQGIILSYIDGRIQRRKMREAFNKRKRKFKKRY